MRRHFPTLLLAGLVWLMVTLSPATALAQVGAAAPPAAAVIPPEWLADFKGATEEQRDTWSPEKLKAWRRWMVAENARLDAEGEKIKETNARKAAEGEKLDRDNKILGELIKGLHGVRDAPNPKTPKATP